MPDTPAIDAAQLAHLQTWQGRSETLTDLITASPVDALSATLDRDDPAPQDASVLPGLWHWMYFLPHARAGEVGPDGHPKRGGFLPPVPLPRRMWAGARLAWEPGNPLRVGQKVQRQSTIRSVTHKAGRSGELLFVLVEHQYRNAHGLALTEEHDIVYRAAARPGDPAPAPQKPPLAGQAAWSRTITPDPVLLFRYSALTFNGHRIHYDRKYVTEVEGYAGLVVHGPLIATLLLDLLRRQMPDAQLARFDFRAVRPTTDLHPFSVHGKPSSDGKTVELWAQDHEGWLTMQATATLL
ncbi:FAS1-like dehydratase domain-containing protein [Comamonas faecalis]